MIRKLFGRDPLPPHEHDHPSVSRRSTSTSLKKFLGKSNQPPPPLPITLSLPAENLAQNSPRIAETLRSRSATNIPAISLPPPPEPFLPGPNHFKAMALYPYTADDPTEISLNQGEILYIVEKQDEWWQARNSKGSVGLAPSNYFQLL
ncbi:osmosensor protein [Favolaschia claudopus]|uniref:Osmosensor protein n=1 Tax=Favolaschia claudopus TaxID=2862362 RepID=A0AAW0DTX3_9AGAR